MKTLLIALCWWIAGLLSSVLFVVVLENQCGLRRLGRARPQLDYFPIRENAR